MSGALIAARRLIYQNNREQAQILLRQLSFYAAELHSRRDETQFAQLAVDFTSKYHKKFQELLIAIEREQVSIADLVVQANCDCLRQLGPPEPFNLAMSALAAFIIDKNLARAAANMGVSKSVLSDESNSYAVLSPGTRGSTSADRMAFLSALNLKNNGFVLRIDSLLPCVEEKRRNNLPLSATDPAFNLLTIENVEANIEITTY